VIEGEVARGGCCKERARPGEKSDGTVSAQTTSWGRGKEMEASALKVGGGCH